MATREDYTTTAKRRAAQRKGRFSEWLAACYLYCKGYQIIAIRFKTPVGEIDLLARKGNTLIAVEVKNRSTLDAARFAITPRQQRRIERAVLYYLSRRREPLSVRFDVILITPRSWPFHLKEAWRYGM